MSCRFSSFASIVGFSGPLTAPPAAQAPTILAEPRSILAILANPAPGARAACTHEGQFLPKLPHFIVLGRIPESPRAGQNDFLRLRPGVRPDYTSPPRFADTGDFLHVRSGKATGNGG